MLSLGVARKYQKRVRLATFARRPSGLVPYVLITFRSWKLEVSGQWLVVSGTVLSGDATGKVHIRGVLLTNNHYTDN